MDEDAFGAFPVSMHWHLRERSPASGQFWALATRSNGTEEGIWFPPIKPWHRLQVIYVEGTRTRPRHLPALILTGPLAKSNLAFSVCLANSLRFNLLFLCPQLVFKILMLHLNEEKLFLLLKSWSRCPWADIYSLVTGASSFGHAVTPAVITLISTHLYFKATLRFSLRCLTHTATE